MDALIAYAETDTTPRFTWQATGIPRETLSMWRASIEARLAADEIESRGLAVSPDPDQVLAILPRQQHLPGVQYSLDPNDWPQGTFFYFGSAEVGVRRQGEQELCYVEARP